MLPRPASRPGGNFSQFGFNPAPADRPVTLGLSSLDVGMPLTGVAVTTSRSGPVTTAFGADFVQFLFFDQAVSAGRTCISAQFTTTPVPELQTSALMLLASQASAAWPAAASFADPFVLAHAGPKALGLQVAVALAGYGHARAQWRVS